jgi:hypothetical protein
MTDNFIISILNTLGKEEEYVIIFIDNLFFQYDFIYFKFYNLIYLNYFYNIKKPNHNINSFLMNINN